MDIKKPATLFPRLFRTFSMFIIVALCSFFGCIHFFGESPIGSYTPSQNAPAEVAPFGKFVQNMMAFKNIEAKGFNFAFKDDSQALDISLQGDLTYDESGVDADINLIYNNQPFNIRANYVQPTLFVGINEKDYKFEIPSNSGESLDLSGLMDFVSSNLPFDVSGLLDKLMDFFGIDLDKFDVNDLGKDPVQLANGGYRFILTIGNGRLNAEIETDDKFNITSAKIGNITIGDYALSFNAGEVLMNNSSIKVEETELEEFVDLTDLTNYVLYTKNLFENSFVNGNITFKLQDKVYDAQLLYSNTDKKMAKLTTNIEGLSVELILQGSEIFADVNGLKLKLDVNEIESWLPIVEKILENNFNTTAKDALMELISKVSNKNVENVDIEEEIFGLLSQAFGKADSITEFLPEEAVAEENAFTMLWKNGAEVRFEKAILENLEEKDILKTLNVNVGDINFNAEFTLASEGFEFSEDGYYDVSALVRMVGNVMSCVEAEEIGFNYKLLYNNFPIEGTVKLRKGNAEAKTQPEVEIVANNIFGEELIARLHEKVLYITYGQGIKLKVSLDKPEGTTTEEIVEEVEETVEKATGVTVNFGAFKDLIDIFTTYDVKDYFENLIFEIGGDTDSVLVSVRKAEDITKAKLISLGINLADEKLQNVKAELCDGIVSATISVMESDIAMSEFNAEDYKDYEESYMAGLLDSLEFEKDVYAFSSDISIRYSTNAFYGKLTALVVEDMNYNGKLGHLRPAIQVYTTSLGLNSYIYLVDDTVYIDINGLQIKAEITTENINKIIEFVKNEFGIELVENGNEDSFSVILPALTEIYAQWLEDCGLLVRVEDNLQYMKNGYFSDMVLKVLMDKTLPTVAPSYIVVGANIHDVNTVTGGDYSKAWLVDADKKVIEEEFTKTLNFAIYLDNIDVGSRVGNLYDIFGSDSESDVLKNITKVQSNIKDGDDFVMTNLKDFNDLDVVLEMTSALYNYAMSFQYQLNLTASIEGEADEETGEKALTTMAGDITMAIGEMSAEEENLSGFKLFGNKYLQVYLDGLNIKNSTINGDTTKLNDEHLIDLRYRSTSDDPSLYLTYSHNDYSDDEYDSKGNLTKDHGNNNLNKNFFRAQIRNSKLSDIISMVLAFANVELGDKIVDGLGLPENTTDFSFLQKILNADDEKDLEEVTSKVDGLLASVENMTKTIKQITLNDSSIVILLDLEGNGNIATISINFAEENGAKKLDNISVSNLSFGGNIINLTLTFNKFDMENFKYFEKNPLTDESGNKTHIDFSDGASFVDSVVNTVNQKNYNFSGTLVADLSIATVNMDMDLSISVDEENQVSAYVQFITKADGLSKVAFDSWSFDKRISTIEYSGENIYISQYDLKGNNLTRNNIDKSTYHISELNADNLTNMIKDLFGFSSGIYNIIVDIIKGLDINPTIEEAIMDYKKTDAGYVLSVNGENLLGSTSAENMDFVIGNKIVSGKYAKYVETETDDGVVTELKWFDKEYEFIDSISTVMKISIIKLTLDLHSGSGDSYSLKDRVTTESISGDAFPERQLFTNEHYRQNVINQIYTGHFIENGGIDVVDVEGAVGTHFAMPTISRDTTFDYVAKTKTTWEFDGWWTTSTFKKGTQVTEYTMPHGGVTLYAKWKPIKVEPLYAINLYHNDELVKTIYSLAGETVSISDFADCGLSEYGYEFYYKADNTSFSNLIVSCDVDLYFKNYYRVEFNMVLNYIPLDCADGCHYVTAPADIDSVIMLEGETLYLTDDKYQPTCRIAATAVGWTKYNYKATTWGTSKHADYKDGGNGFTSIVITGNTTLLPYWKKI